MDTTTVALLNATTQQAPVALGQGAVVGWREPQSQQVTALVHVRVVGKRSSVWAWG